MSASDRASTRPRLLIAALFVALVAGAVTVWLIAGRSDHDSERHSKTVAEPVSRPQTAKPPAEATAPRHRGETSPRHTPARHAPAGYRLLPRIEPARIVADPDPVAPADVLQPIVNGWRAGDHHGITVVEAGLAGDDPSGTNGRFVIFRERERPFSQDLDVVDVRGAGALRITRAPTGRRAGSSAQRQGKIEFAGETGITGTLHLKDDTITIDSR